MNAEDERQPDLFSDVSDLDLVRQLLADLHDDLPGKVSRFRQITDLGRELGRNGTMVFGGHSAYLAWTEARSAFVHGNFVATVLLCQSLVEHLLAAFLGAGLLQDDLPQRVSFRETLKRCRDHNLISDEDASDLGRLMDLRNPLSHFRHVYDESNLDRRSLQSGEHPEHLIRRDAEFAIGLATRVLAKAPFRVG